MSSVEKSSSTCCGQVCGSSSASGFSGLIKSLKALDLGGGESQVEKVRKLLESYVSDDKDFKDFVFWSPHKYTRNLVDDGNGQFNFLILCWGESQGSSIHSHAGSNCMMKILRGTLKESQFNWPTEGNEREMEAFQTKTFKRDDVTYINDSIGLHRVENPSHTEGAVSLHLYWPPFDECSVFDTYTGKEGTGKMEIWSKNGQLTEFGKQSM